MFEAFVNIIGFLISWLIRECEIHHVFETCTTASFSCPPVNIYADLEIVNKNIKSQSVARLLYTTPHTLLHFHPLHLKEDPKKIVVLAQQYQQEVGGGAICTGASCGISGVMNLSTIDWYKYLSNDNFSGSTHCLNS